MKKKKLEHSRTCVFNVNYHIVFSTKYRKKNFNENISSFMKAIFFEIAKKKNFAVQMVEIGQKNHVHIFGSSYIVKMLKGISARKAFIRFPELKKVLYKGHLWNPSYYIETIGSISEESIKKYIEIDQYYPSSKECCKCNFKNKNLGLNERKWICPSCKTFHDRNYNATINQLKIGLEQPKLTPVDYAMAAEQKYLFWSTSYHKKKQETCHLNGK